MINKLIAFMEEHCESFAESRREYMEFLNRLRAECDDADVFTVSVDEFDMAVHDVVASDLVYSVSLGFKDSSDYIDNPLLIDYSHVGSSEIRLREGPIIRRPSSYEKAYAMVNAFYNQLSMKQKTKVDSVMDSYKSYLETVAGRLVRLNAYKRASNFYRSFISGYSAPSAFEYAYGLQLTKFMDITMKDLLDIDFEEEIEFCK